MGGKKKPTSTQPRVKDNLKPSSSEKAAQFLLNQTGSLGLPDTFLLTAPFSVSNSSSNSDGSVAAFVPLPQNPDAVGLNPDLLSILKRLDKKDAVTKQKALQDLCDALKQRNQESNAYVFDEPTILAVLPFWPPIYIRISRDSDRKVREWAQMAMNCLADRVGRELGAYVKKILPMWTLGTVDAHEPAANVAKQGLSSTFPGPKQREAYHLCARQLLDLLEHSFTESLSMVTALTQDKNRKHKSISQGVDFSMTSSQSQIEGAFNRLAETIRFTELLVLRLASLPEDSQQLARMRSFVKVENLWSPVASIIEAGSTDSRLALIGTSSTPHIALFKLCSSLCSDPTWRQWFEQDKDGRDLAAYLCCSTIGQLGSSVVRKPCEPFKSQYALIPDCANRPLHAHSWEAALSCLHYVPSTIIWSVVDWRTQVIPRLKDSISNDSKIIAKQIYPNLLALLSKLPVDWIMLNDTDCEILGDLFISSLMTALEDTGAGKNTESTDVQSSSADPSISVTIVTGLLECARFMVDRCAPALDSDAVSCAPARALTNRIVSKVILRLLADALNATESANMSEGTLCCMQLVYQDAFLDAVFSNVARLLSNLRRSDGQIGKRMLSDLIIDNVFHWVSGTGRAVESSNEERSVSSFDPLRLIRFIDSLASVDCGLSPVAVHQRTRKMGTPPCPEASDSTCPVIQSHWCLDLFLHLHEKLHSVITRTASARSRSLLYLPILSLIGYLPVEKVSPIADFETCLFDVILGDLPENIQLPAAVIEGAIKLWCKESGSMVSTEHPVSVYPLFINHFLPRIFTSSKLKDLLPRLTVLLTNWITCWAERLLHSHHDNESIATLLSHTTTLLSIVLNPKYDRTPELERLQLDLMNSIDAQAHSQTRNDLSTLHPTSSVLSWLYTWTHLLESILRLPIAKCDAVQGWILHLARLLFSAYSLQLEHSAQSPSSSRSSSPYAELIQSAETLLTEFITNDTFCDLAASFFDLLLQSVISVRFVPVALVQFVVTRQLVSRVPDASSRWLNSLSVQIRAIFISHAMKLSPSSIVPSRSVLSSFGYWSMLPDLASAIRLHQFGLQLGLDRDLMSNESNARLYTISLGLLRACSAQAPEHIDLLIDIGWSIGSTQSTESEYLPADPVKCIFNQKYESFLADYGRLWYGASSPRDLTQLLAMFERDTYGLDNSLADQLLQSTWNSILFNRIRSVHPNVWPRDLLVAASGSDETTNSWTESYVLSPADTFRRLCDLYLPAGVVRRCLPRQELLGRFLSLVGSVDSASDGLRVQLARVFESCASLVSVRSVAPIYMSTFLPIFTVDAKSILTEFGDLGGSDDSALWTDSSVFIASISTMCFFETLLLLWQPWQWTTDINSSSDKMVTAKQLGLIQLSLRLQQLRPSLTQPQWDFLLCTITSWGCVAAEQVVRNSCEAGMHALFAFRAFRLCAALGAMFLETSLVPLNLESVVTSTLTKSTPTSIDDVVEDELDPESDEVALDDDQPEEEDSTCEEIEDKTTVEFTDEEEVDPLEADVDGDDDELVSCGDRIIFPRRGRISLALRTDWDKFFSFHLYSSLLPALFKSGLLDDARDRPEPPFLQELCATFTTCPVTLLVRMLEEQRHLVAEYLFELDESASENPAIKHLIQTRLGSWNDLSLGLRASFTLSLHLIRRSRFQCGQLLGHVLLTRLSCARARRSTSLKVFSLGNHLVHRLPTLWLCLLNGPLPKPLEEDLACEEVLTHWGRGSRICRYLLTFTREHGWNLLQEAHQQLLSYLLAWDAFLSFFTSTGPQARSRLQENLLGASASLFDRFVLTLGLCLPPTGNLESMAVTPCRLEPDERLLLPVSSRRTDLIAALTSLTAPRQRRPMRLHVPLSSGDDREWRDAFAPDDSILSLPKHRLLRDIGHLSARLLRRLLAESPALFRAWYTRLTVPSSDTSVTKSGPLSGHKAGRLRQLSNFIDSLISRHLSAKLARDEVVLVHYKAELRKHKTGKQASSGWFSLLKPSVEVGSVSIRSLPSTREVIATYQATDDHKIEMFIQLPTNYPLGLATVTCGRGPVTTSHQWHIWSVQLSLFINNQNGSILDGIDLWQRNARKKFEGVEECAICYSVLHNTNFTMPKMRCHTCRKLFHYACMHRWFITSRNPVCPLCRNMFFAPTLKRNPLPPNSVFNP